MVRSTYVYANTVHIAPFKIITRSVSHRNTSDHKWNVPIIIENVVYVIDNTYSLSSSGGLLFSDTISGLDTLDESSAVKSDESAPFVDMTGAEKKLRKSPVFKGILTLLQFHTLGSQAAATTAAKPTKTKACQCE